MFSWHSWRLTHTTPAYYYMVFTSRGEDWILYARQTVHLEYIYVHHLPPFIRVGLTLMNLICIWSWLIYIVYWYSPLFFMSFTTSLCLYFILYNIFFFYFFSLDISNNKFMVIFVLLRSVRQWFSLYKNLFKIVRELIKIVVEFKYIFCMIAVYNTIIYINDCVYIYVYIHIFSGCI